MKKISLILLLILSILVSACATVNEDEKKVTDTDSSKVSALTLKSEIRKNLYGYKVAFASSNSQGGSDIWMADVDGSNEKQLTKGQGDDIYPEWSSDGEYIYYTSNKHGGALELYRVNTGGKPQATQLSLFGKEVRSISLSKDNTMIALGIMSTSVPMGADLKDYSADLYVVKMDTVEAAQKNGQVLKLEDLTLLLSEPQEKHIWHEQPCFQKTVAYDPYIAYVRTENYDNDPIMKDAIWLVKTDGSENKELLSEGSMPQWTFDDQGILTHEFQMMDLKTKTQKKLKIDGLAEDAGSPSVSPDGKFVIFETTDRNRQAGLARVVYEGDTSANPIELFSERPAYEPRWSPVPVMDVDLSSQFSSDENWFEAGGAMERTSELGQMKSNSEEIAEAWYKYDETLSMSRDFTISAKVKVPKYWDKSGKENGQVGVGIFVGKAGDDGKLVYECDLCTINDNERFVQGQMIKNRKSGEPVDVGMKPVTVESGIIEILYKADVQTLSLTFDGELISTYKIDSSGPVNWQMKEGDNFIVGFMGFSEWVKIDRDYPSVELFNVKN